LIPDPNRSAEERGWAWTHWQFDSDFIVYDIDKDRWAAPILAALIKKGSDPKSSIIEKLRV